MEPHERLSQAMNDRRLELRLQWKQLAAGAGISPESLGAIRRGDYRPSELTARGIEETLRWRHGSVYEVLDDDSAEPVPLTKIVTAGAASGSATAYDAHVHAVRDERVLVLLDQRRAGRPVEELAAAAGMDVARWQDIIAGVVYPAPAPELARMGRALGVTSGDIRRTGHPEAANELQDMELDEKWGHKTAEELDAESLEILQRIRAAIDRDREQMDETGQSLTDHEAAGLAKMVAVFRRRRRDAS